ncbi:hypothetical protein BD289DRAFT_33151 [Coniella lustricola]|uniref:Uncharacterized protein n=1 Tax=Coniella lustricola TaxID=2025994 RepID=A0A2T3A2N6_9PEZI|nr:hypothetical protein BD289DRAFT_33151 [Coniella lustricola]
MASYSNHAGPLSGSASTSSTNLTTAAKPGSPRTSRGQAWASATWATGQHLLSGILSAHNNYRKDYDVAQHHRPDYSTFRDDILMPPAYDSIVPASHPHRGSLLQQQHSRPQAPSPSSPLNAHSSHSPTATTATSGARPVSRPSLQSLVLPPIPRLLGLENLDEWDDVLKRTLRFHGLIEYISAPHPGVPEPSPMTPSWSHKSTNMALTHEQWTTNRAAVCLLMVGSFSSDVRDTLLASGYDALASTEEDPKVLHDLVLEAIPKAAGEDVTTWMSELSTISPGERRFDNSLREFALRLQYLRRRLYQAEPQPNDNLVLVMAVLGLARCETYEGLSMTLGRELERGALTWARFMGDLSTAHSREVRERRRLRAKGISEDDRGS